MSGSAFVSYARTDAARVRLLVKLLADAGIDVWWDREIEPGERFREAIDHALEKASCVIVAWSHDSTQSDWVRAEADGAMRRGVMVPVLLDAGANIPRPFAELNHVDLTRWTGESDAETERLLVRVRRLCARSPQPAYAETLAENNWGLDGATHAAQELSELIAQIRTVGEVLTWTTGPAQDVRGALTQVAKTYRSVMDAVKRFTRPAIGAGPVDPDPYLEFEGGVLESDIRNGRGHCHLILTHYGKVNGLRDWLEPRMDKAKLAELDGVFGRLGTADGDLFEQMTQIGALLTNESRVIVNLLMADQEAAARQRIKEGRDRLLPLQQAVGEAQRKLEELQTSLGFATGG